MTLVPVERRKSFIACPSSSSVVTVTFTYTDNQTLKVIVTFTYTDTQTLKVIVTFAYTDTDTKDKSDIHLHRHTNN